MTKNIMQDFLKKNFIQHFNNFKEALPKFKEVIPQHKNKTFVGLDIGSTSVKLVRIGKTQEGYELDRFAIEPVSQTDIKSSVRKALEKADITSRLVNTSVSGQGIIIRYVQMPKMPLADIRSSIRLEADKYFPFPIDDVVMDCFILEEMPAENKSLVLVAAAKKDLIEQRINLFSSLNLEIETIYTDSVAIANLFNILSSKMRIDTSSKAAEKPAASAIINIGATTSNLNIMKTSFPCFTRDIFIGGIDFTKRISNILGLDIKAAEELKSDPKDQKEKVLQACESILNSLINEIKLSFDYFESENNTPITSLFLSGGGACLSGLVELMGQNLGIEVKLWQPLSGIIINPALAAQDLSCHANKLSVAIGTALK